MSNYPPGFSGGATPYDIRCECKQGHVWFEEGYEELGATYFADEESEHLCPECGGQAKFVDDAENEDDEERED